MARKERRNVDYFPHPVTHGKSMFYIKQKYKNDGYAVWFMLLEQLGREDHHYLNLNDDIQLMFLSAEMNVEKNVLESIINDLVKLGQFDSELWDNGILFNEKFVESIQDAYKKRNNDIIDKNSLLLLLDSKGILKCNKSNPKQSKSNLKGSGNTQSKVKDSKEKEIRGILTSFELEFKHLKNSKFYDLFLEHCLLKTTTKTERAIKSRLKEISDFDLDWCFVRLEKAITSGWKGLVFEDDKKKGTLWI